ncbi:MAG: hypothetical protein H3C60_09445, partial [Sphingomonadaceae bacterium]|nr:hypothetical protein [Sphingomonadaceae bacterium]
MKLYGM